MRTRNLMCSIFFGEIFISFFTEYDFLRITNLIIGIVILMFWDDPLVYGKAK